MTSKDNCKEWCSSETCDTCQEVDQGIAVAKKELLDNHIILAGELNKISARGGDFLISYIVQDDGKCDKIVVKAKAPPEFVPFSDSFDGICIITRKASHSKSDVEFIVSTNQGYLYAVRDEHFQCDFNDKNLAKRIHRACTTIFQSIINSIDVETTKSKKNKIIIDKIKKAFGSQIKIENGIKDYGYYNSRGYVKTPATRVELTSGFVLLTISGDIYVIEKIPECVSNSNTIKKFMQMVIDFNKCQESVRTTSFKKL